MLRSQHNQNIAVERAYSDKTVKWIENDAWNETQMHCLNKKSCWLSMGTPIKQASYTKFAFQDLDYRYIYIK